MTATAASGLAENLRVSLVSSTLPLGGSTTFLCNLAGELVRRNIPVQVLGFAHDCPLAPQFRALGIPLHLQDERRLIFEDRMQRVLATLQTFAPTVVVACLGAEAFEVLRYVPEGVQRLGMVQSDDPDVYAYVRHYGACVDGMAGVSATIARRLRAMEPFRTIPVFEQSYGVPMPAADHPRRPPATGPLRILYVGRLEKRHKRAHLFPAIRDRLVQHDVPFRWTLAGEGTERAALERLMACTTPSQTVQFVGMVPYDHVPKLLEDHDVFLLVSDCEGLPLSLLEAMGHGLVPVVSDLESGIREVVNSECGILVHPGDLDGYADGIRALHLHRDGWARRSQQARERVQTHFSIRAMAERWLACWNARPQRPATWAPVIRVKPILAAPSRLRYSAAGRWARRLLKGLAALGP